MEFIKKKGSANAEAGKDYLLIEDQHKQHYLLDISDSHNTKDNPLFEIKLKLQETGDHIKISASQKETLEKKSFL